MICSPNAESAGTCVEQRAQAVLTEEPTVSLTAPMFLPRCADATGALENSKIQFSTISCNSISSLIEYPLL